MLVKTLLQRDDAIANCMFEAWKKDVRRETGGEKFASNTPRAVALRNAILPLPIFWHNTGQPLNLT